MHSAAAAHPKPLSWSFRSVRKFFGSRAVKAAICTCSQALSDSALRQARLRVGRFRVGPGKAGIAAATAVSITPPGEFFVGPPPRDSFLNQLVTEARLRLSFWT